MMSVTAPVGLFSIATPLPDLVVPMEAETQLHLEGMLEGFWPRADAQKVWTAVRRRFGNTPLFSPKPDKTQKQSPAELARQFLRTGQIAPYEEIKVAAYLLATVDTLKAEHRAGRFRGNGGPEILLDMAILADALAQVSKPGFAFGVVAKVVEGIEHYAGMQNQPPDELNKKFLLEYLALRWELAEIAQIAGRWDAGDLANTVVEMTDRVIQKAQGDRQILQVALEFRLAALLLRWEALEGLPEGYEEQKRKKQNALKEKIESVVESLLEIIHERGEGISPVTLRRIAEATEKISADEENAFDIVCRFQTLVYMQQKYPHTFRPWDIALSYLQIANAKIVKWSPADLEVQQNLIRATEWLRRFVVPPRPPSETPADRLAWVLARLKKGWLELKLIRTARFLSDPALDPEIAELSRALGEEIPLAREMLEEANHFLTKNPPAESVGFRRLYKLQRDAKVLEHWLKESENLISASSSTLPDRG